MDPSMVITPDLNLTYGVMLLGAFFSFILYGLFLNQAYTYISSHITDPPFIRLVVVSLVLLETLQVAFTIHAAYYLFVIDYDNPSVKGVWSFDLVPLVGGIIHMVSQAFFARRVSLISFKYKLAAAVAVICLLVTFVVAVDGFTMTAVEFLSRNMWLIYLTYASATVTGATLTASIFLATGLGCDGFKAGGSFVDAMVTYVVNTGLLVAVSDALTLILAATSPRTFLWAANSTITVRLYANCLLSVLNSRKLLSNRGMEILDAGADDARNIFTRAERHAEEERWNLPQRADYLTPESINIQVTQEFDGDGDVNWGGCGKDSSQKQAPSKNAIGGRKGFYSIGVKSHQIWKISGWRGPSAGELAQS